MPIIAAPTDRLEYNGLLLEAGATSTTVTAKFVYDAAGRTVTHTVLTIRAKSKVVFGGTQDVAMSAVRVALERPGGVLVFTGKGYDIEINGAGKPRDVRWGPKPSILEWRTLGGGQGADIVWVCEVALNNCEDAAFTGILEYNYTLGLSTDEGGYSVRTVTGTLVIAATRVGVANRAIPDTADNYFDRVCPLPIANYKRTIQRTLNEGKDKLQFTVTDTEMGGNPLPAGVVAASGSHELSTSAQGAKGFQIWNGTLSADYEMQKGVARSTAYGYFLTLLADRANGDRPDWFWMPLSMRIAEPEIYGRKGAAFSMTYTLMRDKHAPPIMWPAPVGALWRPVPGADWNVWAASLPLARGNRGIAGLKHRAADDVIVDLCLNQGAIIQGGRGAQLLLEPGNLDGLFDWADFARALNVPAQVAPIGSWTKYECRLVVEPVTNRVLHTPLATAPLPPSGSTGTGESVLRSQFATPRNSAYFAPQVSPPTIVQVAASDSFFVRLVGRAVRIGHEISPPALLLADNSPVHEANDPRHGTFFSTWTAGYTTHPIQAAEWNLRYFVQRAQGSPGLSILSPPRPDEPGNIFRGTVR